MGIIDIVVIAILVISLIFGFIKGFMKQIVKAASGIIAFLLATAFCKKLGVLLFDSSIGNQVLEYLNSYFASKGELFTTNIETLSKELLETGLTKAGIPNILHGTIINSIGESGVINFSSEMTLGMYFSTIITNALSVVVAFILIYLVVLILVRIIGRIIAGVVRGTAIGVIDSCLGGCWAIVKSVFIISLIFLILSFVLTFPFAESINTWVTNDMKLADESFGIAKFLYQNNPILFILNKINISSMLDSIIPAKEILFINNPFIK